MQHVEFYPLVFTPIIKELVWGGRNLGKLLKKRVPKDRPIGETWEIVDLPNEQSIVSNGPLAGQSLETLISKYKKDLLGPVALDGDRFPLLVKHIDAAKDLSVQVHPDENAALRLGSRAKSEAWYILSAQPGAVIYLGLVSGCTKEQLKNAIEKGSVEKLLVSVPVKPGEMVFVSPGTVHAIGAGILLAEVQQPSDTTYRVYDWGRVGLDGKPRQLHVEQALQSIDFESRPRMVRDFVDAGHFQANVEHFDAGQKLSFRGQGPVVLVGLSGQGIVSFEDSDSSDISPKIKQGIAVLVPHSCRATTQLKAKNSGSVLVVSFPK